MENLDSLLDEVEISIAIGDRSNAGALLGKALNLDYNYDRTWRVMHSLLAPSQPFETFKSNFIQKHMPRTSASSNHANPQAANPVAAQSAPPKGQPGSMPSGPANSTEASQPKPQPVTPKPQLNPWYCVDCQTQNPEKSRHCQRCGKKIGRDCPQCGTIIPVSVTFCANCGANIKVLDEENRKQLLIRENAKQIVLIQERIALELSDIEDWQDALVGNVPSDIDLRSSNSVFRKYKRMEAGLKQPSMVWLWMLISVGIGFLCALILRIPPEISAYIGLFLSLPLALTVLRYGAGCMASIATLGVAGSIAAMVVAWGGPILIGILGGLISLPIVILLGKNIQKKELKTALAELINKEIVQAQSNVQKYKEELDFVANSQGRF